ncbi:MAG: PhnD/SsuA/transferrin family substrate-binding protein [Anaerolineales bacterium]|nr:PhnD/SsuA/transferrin family substrate-binding protein [Anaerolineales bacterium]
MIKLTSFQASNADPVCRAIVDHIAQQLDIQIMFVNDISYSERHRQFDAGEISGGWICGLPYVQKVDTQQAKLDLLGAPVMQKPRYRNQPVYYSDVVVHRESSFYTFADLQGASWAFNEVGSQSGYNITRYHLANLGFTSGYFSQAIPSGAHQTSLNMVLDKKVDASAIDSTVLETEVILHPEISRDLRIVERLGPSPMPPWVISKAVHEDIRDAIKETILSMHLIPIGQAILAGGQIKRIAQVYDQDYDLIRQMTQVAASVTL